MIRINQIKYLEDQGRYLKLFCQICLSNTFIVLSEMGLFIGRTKTKEDFKKNKESGLFRSFDPLTGKLKEEGHFENGQEVGIWKEYDSQGDQIHYEYSNQRIGARCKDGTTSKAVGRGAGSHHGGVAQWLFKTVKNKIGGTGKHIPIQQRIQTLREKVNDNFRISKCGLEFQEESLKLLLNLTDKNYSLEKELEKQKSKTQKLLKQMSSALEKITKMKFELKNTNKKILELQDFVKIVQNESKIRQKRLRFTNRSINHIVKPEGDESSLSSNSLQNIGRRPKLNLSRYKIYNRVIEVKEDSLEYVLNAMGVSENLSSILEKAYDDDSFFSCEESDHKNSRQQPPKLQQSEQFHNDTTEVHIRRLIEDLSSP